MSKSLMKSASVVGSLTLLSRALGFIREIMFASAFGAGAGMDAFLVALKIPNFGRRLFAEGAFSQAFVPVLNDIKTREGDAAVRSLISVVGGTLGGVLTLVTLLGSLGAPLVLWLFAPGFGADPAKQALGAELLRWTFPYLLFISLTALGAGVLNSYDRFAVPAATPVILNVCLISSAFVDAESVHVLAYAVFLAGVLQFAFQLPSLARLRLLPRPRWGWGDARVGRIVRLMVPILFSSSVAQISLLLDTILASFLAGGSVSWLYYADRLMEFPLGIFSIAVATVIIPRLSAQHAAQSGAAFSATMDWALRVILLLGLPAMLGLFLLAGPLVATLFQRGAFGAHDTAMTRWALMAYAFGFMSFSLVKVLVPGYYARQETRAPVRFGVIALCSGMAMSLSFVGIALLAGFEAPHAGLALATSLGAAVNAALLFRGLRRDGSYVPAPGWRRFGLQLLTASAAMSLFLVATQGSAQAWLDAGFVWRVMHLALLIVGSVLIYFAVLWLAGFRPSRLRSAADV
jgi:putative peptidoglycan lipid II flippase